MTKPVLMIHSITKDIFNIPLNRYILTFDDGTIDHYEYLEELSKIDTTKIFFISTNNIGKDGYLTIDHIKEMMTYSGIEFGGHSHDHKNLKNMSLLDSINHIKEDTNDMIKWFNDNLGFTPSKFCYPFNNDLKGVYTALIKSHGIIDLYGSERIPVEKLLHDGSQIENPEVLQDRSYD